MKTTEVETAIFANMEKGASQLSELINVNKKIGIASNNVIIFSFGIQPLSKNSKTCLKFSAIKTK